LLVLMSCASMFLAGCITTATVPLDRFTPPTTSGGVRLLSGPNVPFEYEEIAYHYRHIGEAHDINDAIARFCQEAKAMSGDAVVNFRIGLDGGRVHYILEGVVVKIKKP
jgi:hypothetical protein